MTKNETIKNFLKPNKIKIGLTFLIFAGSLFLRHTFINQPLLEWILIPDLRIERICDAKTSGKCFYGPYFSPNLPVPSFDYPELAELSNECLESLCPHQKLTLYLFYNPSSPGRGYDDLAIQAHLLFTLPGGIVYYYFLGCFILFFVAKINKGEKRNLP